MKKLILLTISTLLWSNSLYSQLITRRVAVGTIEKRAIAKHLSKRVPRLQMPRVNVDSLLEEDVKEQGRLPLRFGHGVPVAIDIQQSGVRSKLPDGSSVWQLTLASKGAYSINLDFDEFKIPPGGELYLYNADKTMVQGPITAKHSYEGNRFYSDLVPGESAILEYHEPAHVIEKSKLRITRVIHGYRNLFSSNVGTSAPCNINIACEQDERIQEISRAVGFSVIGSMRICSGTLLNDVPDNSKPYFLTANHCLGVGDVTWWSFRFRYASPSCDSNQEPETFITFQGSTLRASSSETDFALLELKTSLENQPEIRLAGWDRSGRIPNSSIGIHHPAGDVMKISYDNDPPKVSTWDFTPESHWDVYFDRGSAEYGSSGSALFDDNLRLIGQVSGNIDPDFKGNNFCEVPHIWYGRFNKSWEGGGTKATRLKDWLDPDNTGATTVETVSPSATSTTLASASEPVLRLYPNPTSNFLAVAFPTNASEAKSGDAPTSLTLYNHLNQVAATTRTSGAEAVLDIKAVPQGLYYLHIERNNQIIKKQVVINK